MRRVTLLVVRAMLFAFGFHWVEVKGVKASRYRAPLIVMGPHSSFFDILPAICMGDICVVTRKENLSIPVIGSKMWIQCMVVLETSDVYKMENKCW